MPSLQEAHLRHIACYEDILWKVNELYLQGGKSIHESITEFDRNWENIQLGHACAVSFATNYSVAAGFCSKYASSGAFILNRRYRN